MSSSFHRTRGAVKVRAVSDRPATFRRLYWKIAALCVCLVLTVLLASWARRSASLVGSDTGRLLNKGESSFVAPLKPNLSSTATAAEIMEELRRVADQLAESFPNDPTALDVLAKVEFALGHRTEAMELWRKCAQLSPDDAAPYFSAMGIVAANSGAPDEAAELFRKAIELGSQDLQTPVMLADNLMKAGQLDDAVAVLETHVQKGRGSNAAALTTLGQAYLELDQCEKAKTTFLAGIQADPNSKTAYYGLARAYARLDDDAQAKTYMEQFAKLDTQAASQHIVEIKTFNDDASTRQMGLQAFINAARCYRAHEDFTNAEQLLQNAASLAPDDVPSRVELVTLYEQLGRNQAAIEICQQLQTIDPKNGDHWMNEGVLSARLGKLEQGLSALRHALQLDPHNRRYREAHNLIQREK